MQALVAELGHPERSFRSVHVAGTNGKGSVVAMVDAALTAAGHRSARYTSPHLVDLSERFVIGGRPAGRAELEAATADLRDAVERLLARGRLQTPPTFFEATTAIAFELFRRAEVEVAVCEVGLGGRLDATNVLEPVVTAITTIGLDHQQYLGHSLADIAREKAGIIKRGVPVVIGRLRAEAAEVVEEVAAGLQAPVVRADPGALEPVRAGASCAAGRASGRKRGSGGTGARTARSEGDRGIRDRPPEWGSNRSSGRDGSSIALCRMGGQCCSTPPTTPTAHWRSAITSRAAPPRPMVFAAMRDKDAAVMIETLAPVVSAFVMTRASNARSSEPSTLAELARRVSPHLTVAAEPTAG